MFEGDLIIIGKKNKAIRRFEFMIENKKESNELDFIIIGKKKRAMREI